MGTPGIHSGDYFLTVVLVHVVVSFLPFSSTPVVFITVVPLSGLVCLTVVSVTRGFELEHPDVIAEIIAANITRYESGFQCESAMERDLSFEKFRRKLSKIEIIMVAKLATVLDLFLASQLTARRILHVIVAGIGIKWPNYLSCTPASNGPTKHDHILLFWVQAPG